ncbi:hypothetical protein Tco_0182926, partial [Tanacetum coccineum]
MPATPAAACHHVAAAGKLFRQSFPVKSKMVPRRPIYPLILLTLCHSPFFLHPPQPPPLLSSSSSSARHHHLTVATTRPPQG